MRGRVNRRDFIAPFSSAATWPLAAGAQKPPKIPRVGYLGSVTPRRAGTARSRHSTTGSETRATWKGKRSRWKSTGQIPAVAIHAILLAGDRGGSPEVGGGASASRGARARGFRGGVRGCGARQSSGPHRLR